MAIALVVNAAAGSVNATDATTAAIDTTGANLLILAVTTFGTTITTANISDNKSNIWSELTSPSSNAKVRLFYVLNPTVGTGHTFSIASTNSFPSIAVAAFSGVSAFDQESVSNTATAGSITPAGNNQLFVVGLCFYPGNTVSISGSFNISNQVNYLASNHMGIGMAYKIQTAGGAEGPTWTPSSGFTDQSVAMATFTAAVVAATCHPWFQHAPS